MRAVIMKFAATSLIAMGGFAYAGGGSGGGKGPTTTPGSGGSHSGPCCKTPKGPSVIVPGVNISGANVMVRGSNVTINQGSVISNTQSFINTSIVSGSESSVIESSGGGYLAPQGVTPTAIPNLHVDGGEETITVCVHGPEGGRVAVFVEARFVTDLSVAREAIGIGGIAVAPERLPVEVEARSVAHAVLVSVPRDELAPVSDLAARVERARDPVVAENRSGQNHTLAADAELGTIAEEPIIAFTRILTHLFRRARRGHETPEQEETPSVAVLHISWVAALAVEMTGLSEEGRRG